MDFLKDNLIKENFYLTGIGYYAQEDIEGNIQNITLWEINGITYGSYVEHPRKCDEHYRFTNVFEKLSGNVMCQIKFPKTKITFYHNKYYDEETFKIIDVENYKTLLYMADREVSEGVVTSDDYDVMPFNCSAIENMFITKYDND